NFACAAFITVAASLSMVLASDEAASPAPGPSSAASATLPVVGTLLGASAASLIAYCLQ
ncbi:hypothetical protein Csa_011936, partial [Cucumis sativus]